MTALQIVGIVVLIALCIGVLGFDAYDATRGIRR
jgi:hypothetical protein